ncbi:hypothetical protein AH04_252 [Erwinia phage AH04]|uniref:Uncharacterized protein n=1 Tax=Erwinia phage AH04 TaxID=2869569 RepID=A0AAE8BR21_9CAUD|nr:hypothetical protein PQC02_gp062 [Erwinia phage AH04]QZA70725.1 hypothetical protein AH04_252 [Erwinia phage AH04]
MLEFSYDYSVLVISEPDFAPTVKDEVTYFEKLDAWLEKRSADRNLRKVSVTGRYGANTETLLDVDDKNKTSFLKSLDDHLNQFDEVIIITNFEKDMFIDSLANRLTEISKPFTIYGYETRGYEKP